MSDMPPAAPRLPYDPVLEEPIAVYAEFQRREVTHWVARFWPDSQVPVTSDVIREAVEKVACNLPAAHARLAEAFFADDDEDFDAAYDAAQVSLARWRDVVAGLKSFEVRTPPDAETRELVRSVTSLLADIEYRFPKGGWS